jgi:hypothetical protein
MKILVFPRSYNWGWFGGQETRGYLARARDRATQYHDGYTGLTCKHGRQLKTVPTSECQACTSTFGPLFAEASFEQMLPANLFCELMSMPNRFLWLLGFIWKCWLERAPQIPWIRMRARLGCMRLLARLSPKVQRSSSRNNERLGQLRTC